MGYFNCVAEVAKQKMGEACCEEMSKPFYEENGGMLRDVGIRKDNNTFFSFSPIFFCLI